MASPSGARTGLIFILSIGFGIAAAVLSMLYLKSREAAIVASLAGEEDQMVAVVVAKQDLPKGQKIAIQDFAVREIPASYVHPNAISASQFNGYVGRFLVEDIARGKPLLTSFLDETFPVDFSDLVKKGRRAMTIQIDEPQAIAGMLRPGNHIDLYVNIATKTVGYNQIDLSGLQNIALQGAQLQEVAAAAGGDLLQRVSSGTANDVIIPVLQNVMVLATGREAYEEHLDELGQPQRRRTSSFSTVTLDVSPTEAAVLAIAEDKGDLIGVLRNRRDPGPADFTGITPLDLLEHAKKMKKELAMREAAKAAGATIDENGNWVTADGKVIKKEDIVISENGTVSTKDGSTLATVGKDGKLVSGEEALRQAAEAAGATIDENGNWVTADGRVINKDDIVVSENGTITTKGGQLLAAEGIRVNENGEYVDANGNVIPKDEVIVNPDGTITTKDDMMRAAGYTVNSNGDYVDANGNVIKRDDVQTLANGTIMTKDGKVLSGPKVTKTKDGFLVAEDGTIMTADGKVLDGVTINENGEVVTADGTVLKDPNLTVAADGTVTDSQGNVIAGVTGSSLPPNYGQAPPAGPEITLPEVPTYVALVLGGKSKDGVALTSTLKVEPVAVKLPGPRQPAEEEQLPETLPGAGQ